MNLRRARIARAFVRCWWHCLWSGFQYGHSMYTRYDRRGRITVIAAVSGGIIDDSLMYEIVFFGDEKAGTACHPQ